MVSSSKVHINNFSLGPTSGNTSNNYDNDWPTFWCLWFWHSIPLHSWIVSYKDQKYSNRHLLHNRQSHISQVRIIKNMVMLWKKKWVLCALAYFDPKMNRYSKGQNRQFSHCDINQLFSGEILILYLFFHCAKVWKKKPSKVLGHVRDRIIHVLCFGGFSTPRV